MGVAHKTMACGTPLDVCRVRCVSVRVVDRGPYVGGREVDLTMATAQAIGFSGVGLVRLRVVR
jgi:rare lipoprotein A (peptidoglycan hydrolase)